VQLEALAREGSADSSMRALALSILRMAAGRSSEAAWATWESMEWDDFLRCVFFALPQSKVSDIKLTCLVAGMSRHDCPFVAMGDYIALNPDRDMHIEGDEWWLLPGLQDVKSPGEKIGSFMQALIPGKHSKYTLYAVASLPSDCTAAGSRPACVTELGAAGVPGEWGCLGTGHDLTKISAWYNYLEAQRLLTNLCATVLAGWKAPPYGQLGPGPVVAMLPGSAGVDAAAFERYVDLLFTINNDSLSHHRQGGRLRPLLHAAATTQSKSAVV